MWHQRMESKYSTMAQKAVLSLVLTSPFSYSPATTNAVAVDQHTWVLSVRPQLGFCARVILTVKMPNPLPTHIRILQSAQLLWKAYNDLFNEAIAEEHSQAFTFSFQKIFWRPYYVTGTGINNPTALGSNLNYDGYNVVLKTFVIVSPPSVCVSCR